MKHQLCLWDCNTSARCQNTNIFTKNVQNVVVISSQEHSTSFSISTLEGIVERLILRLDCDNF